ncbi:MAG TPA: PQQ-dependent sugar dehydrogenase [Gemmatimonadaceae bacterium]|nr:PQQ-dependent sugar dehydrogenase [Gemmatimonadaceae bacterium]
MRLHGHAALLLAAGAAALAAAPAAAQQRTTIQRATVTGSVTRPGRRPFEESLLRRLRVPRGFAVSIFASGLGHPRMMTVADDGTVYVTRRDSGDVLALADTNRDGRADRVKQVIAELPHVHGIAVRDYRLYLATDTAVFSVPLRGDTAAGDPWRLVGGLPDGGQHGNRTLAFGPDGMLYLSIGSSCNACVETNREHATMLRMAADGARRTVFARGLRNTVGWGWDPETKALWGMDHGTDWRGDDIPPEELNRLEEGGHYGWPYCYGAQRVDTRFPQDPPDTTKAAFCGTTKAPTLTYQAHSAPVGFLFYAGAQFPAEYRGDAFVAMRGSWNRRVPTGYKVVRVRFDEGKPVAFEDFLTGFLLEGRESYFARPAGLAVARDGALLISDDEGGLIYRVAYTGAPAAERRRSDR